MVEFFATLTNELRAMGVTAIATWEMRDLFGRTLNAPTTEISSILDNLMVLRSAPVRPRYRRMFSVLKIRDCAVEPAMHEIIFAERGLRVSAVAQVPDNSEQRPEHRDGL